MKDSWIEEEHIRSYLAEEEMLWTVKENHFTLDLCVIGFDLPSVNMLVFNMDENSGLNISTPS